LTAVQRAQVGVEHVFKDRPQDLMVALYAMQNHRRSSEKQQGELLSLLQRLGGASQHNGSIKSVPQLHALMEDVASREGVYDMRFKKTEVHGLQMGMQKKPVFAYCRSLGEIFKKLGANPASADNFDLRPRPCAAVGAFPAPPCCVGTTVWDGVGTIEWQFNLESALPNSGFGFGVCPVGFFPPAAGQRPWAAKDTVCWNAGSDGRLFCAGEAKDDVTARRDVSCCWCCVLLSPPPPPLRALLLRLRFSYLSFHLTLRCSLLRRSYQPVLLQSE
jgi:hypothetical protein